MGPLCQCHPLLQPYALHGAMGSIPPLPPGGHAGHHQPALPLPSSGCREALPCPRLLHSGPWHWISTEPCSPWPHLSTQQDLTRQQTLSIPACLAGGNAGLGNAIRTGIPPAPHRYLAMELQILDNIYFSRKLTCEYLSTPLLGRGDEKSSITAGCIQDSRANGT